MKPEKLLASVAAWVLIAGAPAVSGQDFANRVIEITAAEDVDRDGSADANWRPGLLITDDGKVVAAADDAPENVIAIFNDGRRYPGRMVAADLPGNIALFQLAGLQGEAVPAAGGAVEAGGRVHAVVFDDTARRTIALTVRNPRRIVRSSNAQQQAGGVFIDVLKPATDDAVLGPIFGDDGRVLGFVTLESRPEAKTQVARAMPILEVLRIANDLSTTGRVRRARLGIEYSMAAPARLAAERGLPEPMGLLVATVDKGGPAGRAGIEPGDLVVKLGTTEIRTEDDFVIAISGLRAGDRVDIGLVGPSGPRSVRLTAGELIFGPPSSGQEREKKLP